MVDDDWEMIKGAPAQRIAFLNLLNQINQIGAIIIYSLDQHPSKQYGSTKHLNQAALKELHRTGTFLLLKNPGAFREYAVEVCTPDDKVVYEPPPAKDIERHLEGFFRQLGDGWRKFKPVEAGAFTLWFINWVHPFKNGNGRSARAFCYATIGMRMGYVPPGEKTIPELIIESDEEYEEYQRGLRVADRGYKKTHEPDLSVLEALLDRLLSQQLDAALKADEASRDL